MSGRKRVLVVDDEPGLRLMVRAVLEDDGWQVSEAGSAEDALQLLSGGPASDLALPDVVLPDVVLLDMRMPGMDGLDALGAISRAARGAPVVMLTAYGTVGSAVEAMKRGAFDYLTKPADNEEMKAVLAKALEYRRLLDENASLREEAKARSDTDLVGQTPVMQQVRELIEQAGPSEATVLITGESGTGKELVAQALHKASARAGGPLVKVNIAALPHDLLESELFGYVRGAFTGAARDKPGRFQLARGGTLFLDEIGEMHMALQAKLLRVLQERMVEPLGSVRSEEVDVRILAATNRDLAAEVAAGRFREDLYFRLDVLEIRIPPLRERMDDLPLLVSRLLARLSDKNRKPVREVSPRFLEALMRHDWPGNVRELENALERALILSRTDSLRPEDLSPQVLGRAPGTTAPGALAPVPSALRLPAPVAAPSAPPVSGVPVPAASANSPAAPSSLDEAERQAILAALEANQGHRQKTADALGISRRTLQYKLRKFGLATRG